MSALEDAAGAATSYTEATTALHGLVVLAGGAALLPLAVAAARVLVPTREVFFARWRFLHLLGVLALAFGGALLCGAALQALGWPGHELLRGQIATAVGLGAAGAAILGLAARLDPAGWRCVGLWPGGQGRAVLSGLVGYVMAAPALLGLMLLWPWLWERLGGEYRPQEIAGRLHELQGAGLALLLVLAVLLQPLLEELLFRGFVQPLLVQNLGDRGGIALTSFLFAVLHPGSVFLPIFGLSLLLGAVMLRTQRLGAAIGVHALHNGIMMALLMVAPEAVGVNAPDGGSVGLLQALGGLR